MSPNGSTPVATTAGKFLSALSLVNGELVLAVQVAGLLKPIIVGVVKQIKQAVSPTQEIEYTVVLSTGQDKLDKIIDLIDTDLDEINAELVRLGHPPLQKPGEPEVPPEAPTPD